ncbi:hypothetical protein CHLRE_11g482841v5 [Chlamydomonas reinhardtii]|uniref:RNase III domain-containing protein n=1 Tax=Chlamydomonas reinhardtii TaxID=3055 RepID=A0A2K3D8V4_CHLRE|nr:uncharacterized protein CHLRE_11g482841v5 [Chlamydomonas reinhardtii]PNW76962.1 hypothetical protein CHLRE_11g482841v5 [Chlamydomonas reinhardtii]
MSEMRTYMRRIGGSKAALPRRCSDRRSSLHCTCMLPPPQLTGSAAANPRSIYSPLALAYLGDAVWEAHTRALELELDMLPQGQQARPHESPQALGNTAGPGRLQMPADARQVDSDGAVSSSCTADGGPPLHLPSSGGGGGGTGEEVRGQAAAFNAQQTGTSSSRNGGGDSGGGAPGHGRAAALGHLASLTRQQRKLWASATFQAQVFDALTGVGLPLIPPSPSPLPAPSTSGEHLPAPHPASEVLGRTSTTGPDACASAAASMPITVSPAGAAAIAAAAATDASGAAASQLLVLTPAEADVLRWGRNAAVGSIPKSVSAGTYKKATAVEVLVAHLYLTAPQRCAQLIQAAVSAVPLQP